MVTGIELFESTNEKSLVDSNTERETTCCWFYFNLNLVFK